MKVSQRNFSLAEKCHLLSFVATRIKISAAPTGLSFFFYSFPGFRCASLLRLTPQDRLWANFWSRPSTKISGQALRRLVHRSATDFLNPKHFLEMFYAWNLKQWSSNLL